MARLLLGVSGGIAAYKALEAARLAVKRGHSVRVVQSPAAERFVGRASFEAITGAPVLTSEFEPDPARGSYPGEPLGGRVEFAPISHLALVERAELYVIAPATANTLAKLAHGQADNLLTAAALAAACPVAVAPAMNNRMYLNPATQANLELLRDRGVAVIGPGTGELASHGEQGIGRLAEPADLLEACEALLTPPTCAGLRVLVTAGGTREPIDSVRFVGNRSSGRMGYALAREAIRRGAEVTVIAANVGLEPPPGARLVNVQTAAELADACGNELDGCDVLMMSAAVADFRPAGPVNRKLKKDQGIPKLELEATEDVLGLLADRRRPDQVIVGFAAEHGDDAVELGRGKLERKRLDAIVVNDISRKGIGFESGENEVTI
ncbi:MAG TPA: bifunctional phosphopantothenoylcysteine decarboxylase/phosphopantothenate--cysteine ligase CoaBC, partial [Solirubrobacteraceae bacterium]|nr:bifunctional phosphopantothenoylcysteine decarboxylase/phosphopantothenate--cysteine ligase CoaBC [Solirubrobacteraceae bacterium]